jgi:hypothetical protein
MQFFSYSEVTNTNEIPGSLPPLSSTQALFETGLE